MPRQSGLLLRGGRYYLNMRVPTELRPLYGKRDIIRKSLGTSDRREAIARVRFEAFKLDTEFEVKRNELKMVAGKKQMAAPLLNMSEKEAHSLVVRWFISLEKDTTDWWERSGRTLSSDELEECRENFGVEVTAFDGGNSHYEGDDGTQYLDGFLKAESLDIPKDSPAYQKLRPLFRRALLENAQRKLDLATVRSVKSHEPLFREVFAHTPPPKPRQGVALGEMLTRYLKWLKEAGRADVTQRTYELPARLLREVLGANTELDSITQDDIERLFLLLRRTPTNATKRYPGLTLEQAIEAADKRSDSNRLGGKTLENYFNNVVAIFNFAVAKQYIALNPAKDRYSRATFEQPAKRKKKAKFEIAELNRLFRAPLYTGCKDDGNGYAMPGDEKPRRGRFWLPLAGLFQGFRANEVAQLYTEDIAEIDGVPVFRIRTTLENGDASDKRLKTLQSERNVPIHPELLRIGFLEYVAERRGDTSSPRLFPDNPRGANGYYSSPFGKWFGRFVERTLGATCKATFHSFRHLFRDAMRDAELSIDDAEALGGWKESERSAESLYGSGPSLQRLRQQIAKVNYPGLDLTHLHPISS